MAKADIKKTNVRLGGFSPALADATAVVPWPQKGKTELSPSHTSDYVTNPAESITEAFGAGLDVEIGDSSNFDSGMDFSPTPAPQGFDANQIPKMFEGLLGQIGGQQAPLARPLPADYSPTKTFLATFAGSLGTQLTRNPAILENIQRKLAERDQRRDAIADQNYAQDLLFNQDKSNKLISLRGKILENQIETMLAQGNAEGARIAAENLVKLKAQYEKDLEKMKQAGETARVKMQVEAKTGGEAGKPITMDQMLTQIREIETADPKKLPEVAQKHWGPFPAGKAVVTKQDAAIRVYAGAALGGDTDAVKTLGFTRLMEAVKMKFKIKGQKASADQAKKVAAELRGVGIPWDVVEGQLRAFGFEVGE